MEIEMFEPVIMARYLYFLEKESVSIQLDRDKLF